MHIDMGHPQEHDQPTRNHIQRSCDSASSGSYHLAPQLGKENLCPVPLYARLLTDMILFKS